jgi:4-amino-4-deoxy-L-arabinose transferase-like glycosyltransferase
MREGTAVAADPPGRGRCRARSRFRLILGAIAAVAFVLRLAASIELADTSKVRNPPKVTDMATYRKLATGVAEGRFPQRFYYQPLYYSVFLPSVYVVAGNGPWGPLLAQALLGAATVWLVGLLGAACFGARAGLLGAALLALSRYHIFYTPFLLMAVLVGFLIALLTYLALRAYQRDSWWWWGAAGLVAGAAVLARGNALLLLPGILALLIRRNWGRPRQLALKLLLFCALFYIPQLPFALRNYSYYGEWTGPSSALDPVLALGNNPEAPAGGMYYPCYTDTYEEWVRLADLSRPDRVPVLSQVWKWFLREPLAYIELKFRMFLLFWNRTEIPNNVALEVDGGSSLVLKMPLLLEFSVLGTLGLAGALLLAGRCRRSARRLLLLYVPAAYCAATVMFYILARFRLPLVPILAVLGGLALDRPVRSLLGRRRGRPARAPLLRWALMTAFAALAVNAGAFVYGAVIEKHAVALARPHGVAVVTERKVAVYDHGPVMLGGWRARAVPPGTVLSFRKSFVIDARMPGDLPLSATLRVPVCAPRGSRVALRLRHGGKTVSAGFRARGAAPLEWIEIPVETLVLRRDAGGRRSAAFEVSLSPRRGRLLVYFDERRDYGRTSIVTGGEALPAGMEAAAELAFSRPAPGTGAGR